MALALLVGGQASAQVPAQLPSGAEPGREPPRRLEALPTAPGGGVSVQRAPAAEAPPGADKITFTLTSVEIEGATAFGADELRAAYADRIGKTVSVADAFAIANEIELRYRNAGYVTTRVMVPEQAIQDGRFRIVVVEGFIDSITVADEIGPARAAVQRLLEPLRGVRPVDVGEIERRLLLANDLAGLTVRATLESSPTAPGGSVMLVQAERRAYQGSLTVDNRNSPYLGEAEAIASAQVNAFGSNADQFTFRGRLSKPLERVWSVAGSYQGMFSDDGLMLGLTTSYSRSRPGKELDPLDVESGAFSQIALATYPLIRSRIQNLRASAEYEYRQIDTELSGAAFNEDRLHIVRAGLSYDRTDSLDGISALRVTLHRGLSILNSTDGDDPLASRADASGNFTKLTVDVTRVQQLPASFSLLATATVQHAFDPLLASEEIALGGATYGRGFDSGLVSGDRGWAVSVELRYMPSLPELLPEGAQFYAFVDRGEVWDIDRTAAGRTDLASAGAGVRVNLTDFLFASFEVTRALIGPASNSDETQGFLTITLHF